MADYDLVVIGSGPGGYVAAIRAGQLGKKTALVERDDTLGGVCTNWGCIPSKALLRNAEIVGLLHNAADYGIKFDNMTLDFGKAIDRSRRVVKRLNTGIASLLKKNKVTHIQGFAVLKDSNTIELRDSGDSLSTEKIIIATGARQLQIPSLPIDRETVITSREALELRDIPPRVVIVGGGATGCEFGYVYRMYGSEVTIIELMPRIVPNEDEEISAQLQRAFDRQGIKVMAGAKVNGIEVADGVARVSVTSGDDEQTIECDKVLVAVGVQPNSDGIGLESAGVRTNQRGFIEIDDMMQTSAPGIYAIGDVVGKLALAHVASAQGVIAAEHIAGLKPQPLDYAQMPRAIYCKPQVASIGLTEKQAREQGYSVKIGKFPFIASGKALAMNDYEGMVKVVVDAEIGEILGAHMIGPEVTELLGELGLSRLLEGTTHELGWVVHPHPTISEAIKEAALAAEGEAINI
ncbi:MAG: dihydrolipoyl dehydrogenase [Chloroflexi bacterium]|nr:dihydrolipoyl dehydrogenase [Chloroflexota bacterium]